MASSSDQGPRGILFARRWKVFHYFHIANRYCTNAMPLAKGRLRHPAYLIVDTQRIQEWEEWRRSHPPEVVSVAPRAVIDSRREALKKRQERRDQDGINLARAMRLSLEEQPGQQEEESVSSDEEQVLTRRFLSQ